MLAAATQVTMVNVHPGIPSPSLGVVHMTNNLPPSRFALRFQQLPGVPVGRAQQRQPVDQHAQQPPQPMRLPRAGHEPRRRRNLVRRHLGALAH